MADLMFGFDINQKKSLERLGLDNEAAPEMTLAELTLYVQNLNAWAIAFATKLNADATAQNALAAFPLTLDTNYDTNPQA